MPILAPIRRPVKQSSSPTLPFWRAGLIVGAMTSDTTPLPFQIIAGLLGGSGLTYWYAHLWHHWTAENIYWWPHCFILAGVLVFFGLIGGAKYAESAIGKVLQLMFFFSIIAQVGVWFGMWTKPIF